MVSKDIVEKVIELRKKGLSIREIAKQVNLSHTTVWRILKKIEGEKVEDHKQSKVTDVENVTTSTPGVTIVNSSMINHLLQLNNTIYNILENLKVVENNLQQLMQKLQDLENFKELITYISRLRIEGPTKCKYIDDFGYCTKLILPYCPNDCKCIEVINEYGVKMYRVKVIENSLICIACPYYKPRK